MIRVVIFLLLFIPWPAFALVNINSASLDELDTLPGVGPSIAQKIIDSRPFSSTTDIQNVQGIGGPGTKTYDDIIDLITVSGGSSAGVDTSTSETTTSTTKSTTSKSSDEKAKEPVSGLKANAPEVAFTGQLVNFEVDPGGGDNDRLIRYTWNFGDGSTGEGKSVEHLYKHSGIYVVVVESYYLKETKIHKFQIEVLTPQISLETSGTNIILKNQSEQDMELSGMSLQSQSWTFEFPDHSWLVAGQSLTIERDGGSDEVYLYDQSGRPIISQQTETKSIKSAPVPRISAVSIVANGVRDESPEEVGEGGVSGADEVRAANTAAVINSESSEKQWPYLALLGVILLGLYAIVKFGKKEVLDA